MAGDLKQAGIRVLLGSLFGGVLYVFGSLALLVLKVQNACEWRLPILAYAALGFILIVLVLGTGWRQRGTARLVFLLPAVFFLLGTGIPTWLFVEATRVCGSQAGR